MLESLTIHLPRFVIALQEGGAGGGAEGGGGEAPSPGLLGNPLFMIAIMIAIFWFIVISPEKKKRKQHEQMLSELGKGDQVMTTSGLFGKIVRTKDDVVELQVADGVHLRFSRAAIQNKVDGGGAKGSGAKGSGAKGADAKDARTEPEDAKAAS